MEFDPKHTDVFQLLEKLKEANGTYPQDLLALRRQSYLKQVAAVGAGVGVALALKQTVKGAAKEAAKGATGLSSAASTMLEGILVFAIVAEAGAVTYFYRDKLADLYQKLAGSPKIEEVSSPPVISSPIPGVGITIGPVITGTPTETATPIITPSVLAVQPTEKQPSASSNTTTTNNGSTEAVSTPAVPAGNDNNNNGNHYGNTPIPERTKEPGNTSNNTNDTTNNTSNTGDQSKPKKKP